MLAGGGAQAELKRCVSADLHYPKVHRLLALPEDLFLTTLLNLFLPLLAERHWTLCC